MLLAAAYALHELLAGVTIHDLYEAFGSLTADRILLSLLATAGSYVVLTGYDVSALCYIGARLPPALVALGSFCSYAIANTVGFGLLTGGSVRYRVYGTAGIGAGDIARISTFCAIAFACGLTVVGSVGVALRPELFADTLGLRTEGVRWGGILVVSAAALLIALCGRGRPVTVGRLRLRLPSAPLAIAQLIISAADITLSGAALFVLLPGGAAIGFGAFLPIYCAGVAAGLISHMPGGLGVFEAVLVYALGDRVEVHHLAGLLIAYRAIYYLIPLLAAAGLLAGSELLRYRALAGSAVRQIGDIASTLVPTIFAVLSFIAGVILLASGATPADPARLHLLHYFVPLPLIELSHFLGSIAAIGLVILAQGLFRRINAAFWLAVGGLGVGIVASLLKGGDLEEAVILTLVLVVLLPCRREFYRRTSLLDDPFTPGWILAILVVLGGTVWLTLFAHRHVEYSTDLWWHFALRADAPRSLRALLGVVMVTVLFGILHLLRPPPARTVTPAAEDLARTRDIIRDQDRADAALVLMGDKSILFSESGHSFLMFGRRGGTWVALFDPIGRADERADLVWRFREDCDWHGVRAAFYQVRPETLPLYLDVGLSLVKLGEEARVRLADFSLQGSRRSGLRQTHRRAERDGLSFEIVPQSEVRSFMADFQAISDGWMRTRNTQEKGFSLGAFSPDYIANFDVAVVRRAGVPIAFANIMVTGTKAEATIDLMRHLPDAPRATMDYLFISLMLEMGQQGFAWFNLGMAPLSGLEGRRLAPAWHRAGALLFRYGESFYNFQGLRQFKEKFDPVWEPRYLAAPGGLSPLIVLTDVAALISGGMKGIVSK